MHSMWKFNYTCLRNPGIFAILEILVISRLLCNLRIPGLCRKEAETSYLNPLTTDDECTQSCNFGYMISVGAIHFEDRFCTSKKGGIGGGGWA